MLHFAALIGEENAPLPQVAAIYVVSQAAKGCGWLSACFYGSYAERLEEWFLRMADLLPRNAAIPFAEASDPRWV